MILYRPSKVDGPRTSVKSASFTKPIHRNTNAPNPFGRPPAIISIPHHFCPPASTSINKLSKKSNGLKPSLVLQ